jgi:DNA-binding winged helix-turn-helix (wHTH) protein
MSFPAGSEVASLVRREREELEGDAIDLIVDSRHHLVRTREGGVVDLKKQFVLLKILESLAQAHNREGGDEVRGLSKAELVEKVWNEKYTPALHDNKLYYNINRVRKLIEPEVRRPQYLQNWREGYRLAPDLRVERVSDQGLVEELKQQISH